MLYGVGDVTTADDDHVAFHATGDRAAGQFRCTECSYGVTIRGDLPRCPMCGGEVWEEAAWSPLSRAFELQ